MQRNPFLDGEGTAWFERNQNRLNPELSGSGFDPVLTLLDDYRIWPDEKMQILEVGCANGYRLERIRQVTGASCFGVDPSQEAINFGMTKWPDLILKRGLAEDLPFASQCFSVVIVNYVLHWCLRQTLLRSIAEIDRVLSEKCCLILGDFATESPTKRKYHYKDGIWTYKLPGSYSEIFLATGMYTEVARLTHSHETHDLAIVDDEQDRGAIVLLQKGDYYQLCE